MRPASAPNVFPVHAVTNTLPDLVVILGARCACWCASVRRWLQPCAQAVYDYNMENCNEILSKTPECTLRTLRSVPIHDLARGSCEGTSTCFRFNDLVFYIVYDVQDILNAWCVLMCVCAHGCNHECGTGRGLDLGQVGNMSG